MPNSQSNAKPKENSGRKTNNSILKKSTTQVNVNLSQNVPQAPLNNTPLQLHFHNINQQQIPLASAVNTAIISPLFFNPLFTQVDMIHPMNFNYLNQGIFIPQTAENNHFFFIPGNIAPEIDDFNRQNNRNITPFFPQNDENLNLIESEKVFSKSDKSNHTDNTSKQLYFVPNLDKNKTQSIQDSLQDNDNYDTFLVPVKIKKETNGNIELLPESNTEIPNRPMNPEQLNILNKIYLIKNQIKSDNATQVVKLEESFMENIDEASVDEGQTLINNMADKMQGYMMVRFKKTMNRELSKIESEFGSKTITSNSLKLSAGESLKSNRDENSFKRVKKKRKSKTQILTLSAYLDKNISPSTQTTSRFRRLRLDDKTYCWNMNSVSCLDTKMRELPINIIQLSAVNSVVISPTIVQFFKQQEVTNNCEGSSAFCEHSNLEGDKFKENDSKVSKLRQWMYMCSMNNCEFSEFQKKIE